MDTHGARASQPVRAAAPDGSRDFFAVEFPQRTGPLEPVYSPPLLSMSSSRFALSALPFAGISPTLTTAGCAMVLFPPNSCACLLLTASMPRNRQSKWTVVVSPTASGWP